MKKYNWLNHLLNFVAVILGVYLAFYINDNAKLTEDKKESELLMKSMINDLSADIKSYKKYQIPINEKHKKNLDSLLILLMGNDRAAINNQLGNIFQIENYVPNSSVYNSLKSSGKIRLINDLNLQKQLSDYYDGVVLECEKKNEIQVNFFMDEVLKWLTSNADLAEMKLRQNSDLITFRNKLILYQSLVDQKIKNYDQIVEDSKELKIQLENLVD